VFAGLDSSLWNFSAGTSQFYALDFTFVFSFEDLERIFQRLWADSLGSGETVGHHCLLRHGQFPAPRSFRVDANRAIYCRSRLQLTAT